MLLLLLEVAAQAPLAESVNCNPFELIPCSGAIFSLEPPGSDCCARLREQQPCFCQYLNDPSLRSYVGSRNGRRVAATCGVRSPRC
ncbi:unnamed protein product [Spirodela intermedia]|uniref:Bifunctional inhibitor/plant lipid transfer protein/seed storage helical domain-containing protein n=1 Tax=Spirodela intermedia TaxID=51605 RepID=A0A7I8IWC7_SPIIN|nr:unnamed protein product [Spirodela intermedia]CAA6661308.1 unnamed protein product [Spirodela intermedia]